jgi:hypothetical protein
MTTAYDRDRIWLQQNGYHSIPSVEFSDRVTRHMEQENEWSDIESHRTAVVVDMLMES